MNRYPAKPIMDQMAQHGRYGDTMLVHMNPIEVAGIAALSPTGQLTTNPVTGQPEAFLPLLFGGLGSLLKLSPLMTGVLSGVGTAAVTGDLKRGLLAGVTSGLTAGAGDLIEAGSSASTAAEGIAAVDPALVSDGAVALDSAGNVAQNVAQSVDPNLISAGAVDPNTIATATAETMATPGTLDQIRSGVPDFLKQQPAFMDTAIDKLGVSGNLVGAMTAEGVSQQMQTQQDFERQQRARMAEAEEDKLTSMRNIDRAMAMAQPGLPTGPSVGRSEMSRYIPSGFYPGMRAAQGGMVRMSEGGQIERNRKFLAENTFKKGKDYSGDFAGLFGADVNRESPLYYKGPGDRWMYALNERMDLRSDGRYGSAETMYERFQSTMDQDNRALMYRRNNAVEDMFRRGYSREQIRAHLDGKRNVLEEGPSWSEYGSQKIGREVFELPDDYFMGAPDAVKARQPSAGRRSQGQAPRAMKSQRRGRTYTLPGGTQFTMPDDLGTYTPPGGTGTPPGASSDGAGGFLGLVTFSPTEQESAVLAKAAQGPLSAEDQAILEAYYARRAEAQQAAADAKAAEEGDANTLRIPPGTSNRQALEILNRYGLVPPDAYNWFSQHLTESGTGDGKYYASDSFPGVDAYLEQSGFDDQNKARARQVLSRIQQAADEGIPLAAVPEITGGYVRGMPGIFGGGYYGVGGAGGYYGGIDPVEVQRRLRGASSVSPPRDYMAGFEPEFMYFQDDPSNIAVPDRSFRPVRRGVQSTGAYFDPILQKDEYQDQLDSYYETLGSYTPAEVVYPEEAPSIPDDPSNTVPGGGSTIPTQGPTDPEGPTGPEGPTDPEGPPLYGYDSMETLLKRQGETAWRLRQLGEGVTGNEKWGDTAFSDWLANRYDDEIFSDPTNPYYVSPDDPSTPDINEGGANVNVITGWDDMTEVQRVAHSLSNEDSNYWESASPELLAKAREYLEIDSTVGTQYDAPAWAFDELKEGDEQGETAPPSPTGEKAQRTPSERGIASLGADDPVPQAVPQVGPPVVPQVGPPDASQVNPPVGPQVGPPVAPQVGPQATPPVVPPRKGRGPRRMREGGVATEVPLRTGMGDVSVAAGGIANVPTSFTASMPSEQEFNVVASAILGRSGSDSDAIINMFIEKYGVEAFQQVRDFVLRSATPKAQTEGMIRGQGSGMDDKVPGMIGDQQPVAVSPGEFIVPADVVSGLGDGSSDAGAEELDKMMDRVRMRRNGTTKQAPPIEARKAMPA